jgi:UDP-glucose:(heptosyl)LPS alpha-1,3-glucosyltransferase
MRVALVILHADPRRGGAERYTCDLAAALLQRGHQVSLLAGSFHDAPVGTDTVELPLCGWTRRGRYLAFLDALDHHLDRHAYDIVHAMLPVRRCHLYHPHAGIAAALAEGHEKHGWLARAAARFANRLNGRRRAFARVERALLADPHGPCVLCLSQYVARSARQYHALQPHRIAILYNGVDIRRFDPHRDPAGGRELRRRLGIAPEHTVALFLAQDFQRKGLEFAILALSRLKRHELILLVVGRPDPTAYRRLASRLGVETQVIFAGPAGDPYPCYSAADLFVLPTWHDPCSLVVLEALAMGLPVISTRHNGACELMREGEHGFVLESADDVAGLAERISLLMDPRERARMSRSCLGLRGSLSHEAHVDALEDIYRREAG